MDIQLRETSFLDFQLFRLSAFWTSCSKELPSFQASSFLDFQLKETSSFLDFWLLDFQPFELPAFGHIFVLLAFWTSRFMNLNLFRLPAQKALQLFALPAFQTSIFLGFQLKVTTGILFFRQLINGIKTGGDILGIKTKGDIFMQYFKSVLLGQSFHD